MRNFLSSGLIDNKLSSSTGFPSAGRYVGTNLKARLNRTALVLAAFTLPTLSQVANAQSVYNWNGGTSTADWLSATRWNPNTLYPGVATGNAGNANDIANFTNPVTGSTGFNTVTLNLASSATLSLGAIVNGSTNASNASLTVVQSNGAGGSSVLILNGSTGTSGASLGLTDGTVLATSGGKNITFSTSTNTGATPTVLSLRLAAANSIISPTTGSTITLNTNLTTTATGSVTKTGAGTLTFNSGSLSIAGGLALQQGTFTIQTSATSSLTVGNGVTVSGGTTSLNGNSYITGGLSVSSGTATVGGTTVALTGGFQVSGGTLTLQNNNAFNTAIFGGATVSGTGTLNLNGSNILGTVAANGNTLVVAGGSIDSNGPTLPAAVSVRLDADTVTYLGATNKNVTFQGPTSLGSGTLASKVLDIRNAGGIIFSNAITEGASAKGFTKIGAGTLGFTGTTVVSSTYSGGITVRNGVINNTTSGVAGQFNSNAAGGSTAVLSGPFGTGALTINADPGATVTFTGQGDNYASVMRVLSDFSIVGASRVSFGGSIDLSGSTRTVNLIGNQRNLATAIAANGDFAFRKPSSVTTLLNPTVANGNLTFANGNASITANTYQSVQYQDTTTFSQTGGVPVILTIGKNVVLLGNAVANDVNREPELVIAKGGYYHLSGSAPYYSLSDDLVGGTGGGVVTYLANNATATTTTLTINGAGTRTFSGSLFDGTAAVANDANIGLAYSPTNAFIGLTKTGSGLQIMTGTNAYSGLTTVNGGTLQFGNGGTGGNVGSGNISVGASGTLVFNRSDNFTLPNSTAGTGTFAQSGSNTITLTGSASFGQTLINSGAIAIGNGGSLAGAITFVNPNTAIYINNTTSTTTFTGTVSGPGTISLAANTVLGLSNSSTATLSPSITGGASSNIVKSGSGVYSLSGDLSGFAGNILINAGTLNFGDINGTTAPVLPSGSITVASGAALGINYGGTGSASGSLPAGVTFQPNSGFGKGGTGTYTLSGSTTLGVVSVTGGRLNLGSGFTTSLVGTGTLISSGAVLDASAVPSFNVVAPGTATVSGSLISSPLLTNSGLINVSGNGAQLSASSITNSAQFTIANTGALTGTVAINNLATGTVTATSGNLAPNTTITNAGYVNLTGGTPTTTNNFGVTINGGFVDLRGSGAFTGSIGNGTFFEPRGASVTFTGGTISPGAHLYSVTSGNYIDVSAIAGGITNSLNLNGSVNAIDYVSDTIPTTNFVQMTGIIKGTINNSNGVIYCYPFVGGDYPANITGTGLFMIRDANNNVATTFSGDFSRFSGNIWNRTVGPVTINSQVNLTGSTGAAAGDLLVTGKDTGVPASSGSASLTLNASAAASTSAFTKVAEFRSITLGSSAFSGVSQLAIATTSRTGANAVKGSVVVTSGLSIVNASGGGLGGYFDLGNNDLIVRGGNLATIKGYVNAWNASVASVGTLVGLGASGADQYTTLAVFQNSPDGGANAYYTSFDGQAVFASDVIVKFTWKGDANLDGVLDGKDFKAMQEAAIFGPSGGLATDVNNDGVVDASDLQAFVTTYNYYTSNTGLPAYDSSINGPVTSAIPEPAALGLLAPIVPMLSRRRRVAR
jgi:autotransporter-associated beta strand protein